MTVFPHEVTFSAGVEHLRRLDAERRGREDRMRNALEIIAYSYPGDLKSVHAFGQFVRATAREGLGRDDG